jgi:hypothetical protein
MKDFLEVMGISFGWFDWFERLVGGAPLPSIAVAICVVFAGIGTVLLNNYTAKSSITTVMNGLILFVGALVGNLLLRGIELPLDPERQAPIVFAMAGMIPAALLMLAINKPQ